jgi:drug/metabolite transporter (DMT)-like permease
MNRRRALALVLFLVVVWGVNWPMMKIALAYTSPLWFVAMRLAIATACLFATLAASGRLALPHRHDWPVLLTIALLPMAGFMGLANLGLAHVPPGRAVVLAYTTPIFVAPMAAFFLKERAGLVKLLGVALGVAGIVILFNPAAVDWGNGEVLLGNGLLLLAALLWAVSIIHVRRHHWRGTPLSLLPWECLIATAAIVLAAFLIEGPPVVRPSDEFLLIMVYSGMIATAFGYWALITVNKELPAVTSSLSLLATPVVGVLSSAIVIGEPLTASLIAGLALTLGGVAATNLADRRPALA